MEDDAGQAASSHLNNHHATKAINSADIGLGLLGHLSVMQHHVAARFVNLCLLKFWAFSGLCQKLGRAAGEGVTASSAMSMAALLTCLRYVLSSTSLVW